jgi:hypothetical protein
MSKGKTNALDALRALIAERQQYEQWISALDAKREGTPEHVFERVQNDYRTRLERVVKDIQGYSEELQLSISTMSSRLVEVAREEDTRREGLQEAELRAAVGEYEPQQWQQLKSETEDALRKIAADRASLDSQLGELRAIQKLSEIGSVGTPAAASAPAVSQTPVVEASRQSGVPRAAPLADMPPPKSEPRPAASPAAEKDRPASQPQSAPAQPSSQQRVPPEPMAAASSSAAASKARTMRTPPGGVAGFRAKPDASKPDNSKTLKCPECGTANYPTEWYCERCGGELATM